MKLRLLMCLAFIVLWGCGSEDAGTGSEDNLAGKTYSRTFLYTPPGGSEGSYTRTMAFSATEVVDSLTGRDDEVSSYGVSGDKVNVTISAGNVISYTLSSDRQTLSQDNNAEEVLTLESRMSLLTQLPLVGTR